MLCFGRKRLVPPGEVIMGERKDGGIMPTMPDAVADDSPAASEQREMPNPREPRLFLVHFEINSANFGQTLALATALYAENWDVHIACRESCALADAARAASLPVHTFADTAGAGFLTAWNLARLAQKQGVKREAVLLHACDPTASHLVAQAWRLNKKFRVIHTRRMPVMEVNAKAARCYQVPSAKIITDSLAGKIALRLSGLEQHLLHTIACGFDPSSQPPRRERADDRVIFAVTGDLLPQSGHSLLFDALALLEKETVLPPWEARILGSGPHFSTLLEEAQSKGIIERLAFLGDTDIAGQLAQCDILVLPSGTGESHMPLILQGWAAQLPIVAVNRLDHAENFQEEGNCLLAQPDDAASLATQMARLAKDGTLRTHLANGGSASLAKFSFKSMISEYRRLYRHVLG